MPRHAAEHVVAVLVRVLQCRRNGVQRPLHVSGQPRESVVVHFGHGPLALRQRRHGFLAGQPPLFALFARANQALVLARLPPLKAVAVHVHALVLGLAQARAVLVYYAHVQEKRRVPHRTVQDPVQRQRLGVLEDDVHENGTALPHVALCERFEHVARLHRAGVLCASGRGALDQHQEGPVVLRRGKAADGAPAVRVHGRTLQEARVQCNAAQEPEERFPEQCHRGLHGSARVDGTQQGELALCIRPLHTCTEDITNAVLWCLYSL